KGSGPMMTVKKKIILNEVITVVIALLLIAGICSNSNYHAVMETVETSMTDSAQIAAESVSWEIKALINIAYDAGCDIRLASSSTPSDVKQQLLDQRVEHFGLSRANLIDSSGMGLNGTDYSDRDYFKNAMNGEVTITEPIVAKSTGELAIIIGVPLWEGGDIGGKSVGCIYFVPDEEFLNDMMRTIHISENSAAYIIDKNGNTIADIDTAVVESGENFNKMAEEDPDGGYSELAAVHTKMAAGETGFANYYLEGNREFMAYAPIEGTDGWSLAVYCPSTDFLGNTYSAFITSMIVLVAAILATGVLAWNLGNRIGNPIRLCTERIKKLAEGDLASPVPVIKTNDETRLLANATESVVGDLNAMISDISNILEEISQGNLNVDCHSHDGVYRGDFRSLIESARRIDIKLNDTLNNINDASEQVAGGSSQVSDGAQSLAQGATEQASSIEELAAAIHTISAQVKDNSEQCGKGRALVDETTEYIADASEKMSRLTGAMGDITDAANGIGTIIKTIEDIAFQTNILALNAAVEAARAGAAGKGFAVVADEVRNLASKSAAAAHETTVLIERAVSAVDNGTGLTKETADAVAGVEERAMSIKDIVDHIADASSEQSDMIAQVTVGIEQISGVVQNNSATAEESAAAAEELSGQSSMLKSLVEGFTLRTDTNDYSEFAN
ncbi:MAG: methyl-accepting chemotaxis protein, partial [Oscillospiraceae bacterium]